MLLLITFFCFLTVHVHERDEDEEAEAKEVSEVGLLDFSCDGFTKALRSSCKDSRAHNAAKKMPFCSKGKASRCIPAEDKTLS